MAIHHNLGLIALLLAGCSADDSTGSPEVATTSGTEQTQCDQDNGGITLPAGFCAAVVAEGVGPARHIAVGPDGDVYVALRNTREAAGGIVALRDTTGDGRADVQVRFGDNGGTGIAIHEGSLYFAPDDAVLRYPLGDEGLRPTGEPDTIVKGLPDDRSHAAKSIAFDNSGGMYVNIGAPSNACQEEDRAFGSPGQDPCPELDQRAGIWRFDSNQVGQTQEDGTRWATGIRNAVAIDFNSSDGTLYAVQHGRDQLTTIAPDLYDAQANAEKPAEEFLRVTEGSDFGWPYCYYDPAIDEKVLAPEYGGDGTEVGRCADKDDPILAFPAHWAPNDLLFYTGTQFPSTYQNGAFIAFHGSWNRAPLPQQGYKVVFVPFNGSTPAPDYQEFATGFPGEGGPDDARYRPMGLAQAPDGSLYITDSEEGKIWRVYYTGDQQM